MDWMNRQLQPLTWKVLASIQAQAAMPKEVNDFCSLGTIWLWCYLRPWRLTLVVQIVMWGVKRSAVQAVPLYSPLTHGRLPLYPAPDGDGARAVGCKSISPSIQR